MIRNRDLIADEESRKEREREVRNKNGFQLLAQRAMSARCGARQNEVVLNVESESKSQLKYLNRVMSCANEWRIVTCDHFFFSAFLSFSSAWVFVAFLRGT